MLARLPISIPAIESLGVSSLVLELSYGIVIIVFNFLILKLNGNTGVAAYGILANIALVLTSVFTGIAQGIQPIVSRHADAKGKLQYKRGNSQETNISGAF